MSVTDGEGADAPSRAPRRARPRPASVEDALELFLAMRARGEASDVRAFAAQHADLGPELESALEVLATLEHANSGSAVHAVPERIGAFRVLREVGRGGMGVVYEAVEEPLGRRVALKLLPPELVSSASARARLRREAQLAARLDHSGIATVYGAGVENDEPWIAMRFVDGRPLSAAIASARGERRRTAAIVDGTPEGPASVRALVSCIANVARALQFAHEQGVVHRDVKPSNIVVSGEGVPVLLDFGLAIGDDANAPALTRTGQTAGTPAYFAPELVSGERTRPDAQSDVYALGVSLYECLTLRRPFEGPTPVALFRAIESGTASDARTLNRDVSRDLAVVVATAMERDPARRYRSAAAFADDLEACAAGRAIVARRVPLSGRIVRWMRREPRQALLAGSLLLATLVAAAFGGNWLASREVVMAAEVVARDQECERMLVEGYAKLLGFERSDALFLRALELDPANLEALAGLALSGYSERKAAETASILERAPITPGFDALRALCARRPVTQDEGLIARAGASALDFFLVGFALSEQKRQQGVLDRVRTSKRALAMSNEAVVRSPHARPFVCVVRARLAGDAEDERASRSAAGALLCLWPDSYYEFVTAATTLSRFDPAAALPLLERAVERTKTDPAPLHELGVVHRDLGDLEASEACMWRALDVERIAEIENSLGVALAMRGCMDEASRSWQRALALDPRHLDALLNTAQALHQEHELEAARVFLEYLLRIDPSHPGAHAYLGLTRFDLGEREEGRDHVAFSIALDGRRLDLWSELARMQRELGERDAALETLDAALERAPRDAKLARFRDELIRER